MSGHQPPVNYSSNSAYGRALQMLAQSSGEQGGVPGDQWRWRWWKLGIAALHALLAIADAIDAARGSHD
jgi:hypothetical protein